jgi:hypothetical protein
MYYLLQKQFLELFLNRDLPSGEVDINIFALVHAVTDLHKARENCEDNERKVEDSFLVRSVCYTAAKKASNSFLDLNPEQFNSIERFVDVNFESIVVPTSNQLISRIRNTRKELVLSYPEFFHFSNKDIFKFFIYESKALDFIEKIYWNLESNLSYVERLEFDVFKDKICEDLEYGGIQWSKII